MQKTSLFGKIKPNSSKLNVDTTCGSCGDCSCGSCGMCDCGDCGSCSCGDCFDPNGITAFKWF